MYKCLATTVGWKASSIDSCNEIVTFVVNEGIMSYHGNIRHLHFAIREQKENLTHAHVAFFSFSLDSSLFLRSVSLPLFFLSSPRHWRSRTAAMQKCALLCKRR